MAARMFRPVQTVIAILLLAPLLAPLLALPAAAQAADTATLRSRGQALLQAHCSRCHAITAEGDSPLKGAPPLRTIYARFAPRELQAELREGLVSRHRDMPQIDFSDEDADAILAYLYALALRK